MTAVASPPVRIGTRGSALALIQARIVEAALLEIGVDVRIATIVTEGDRRAPDTAWGEGAFVTAIESALLVGEVDVAVHSAKDVPTDQDPHLAIAAFLPREAPEDVLVMPGGQRLASLDDVPRGARVGTDSPRRSAFLRALRSDLRLHPLHGNVDTRLRRLDEGETDVLVLAAAGLRRLGREDRISLVLPTSLVPPAPGQGALAIQVRDDDAVTRRLVARLDHDPTRRAVEAERALLAASGGGCRAPLGALGAIVGGALRLEAGYARRDGRVAARVSCQGPTGTGRAGGADPGDGELVRATLVALAEAAAHAARDGDLDAPRVVVTRASNDGAATVLALVDRGLAPVLVPAIATGLHDPDAADDIVRRLARADWVVVTSARTVDALVAASRRTGLGLATDGPRWAAVGAATERALRSAGVTVVFRPERATGATLAERLPVAAGATVLLPRGDLADAALPSRLRERGAVVDPVVVYRTVEGPPASREPLRAALADRPAAVVLASASAVRGWLRLAREIDAEAEARSIPVVAIGPTTMIEARRHGLTVTAEAAAPDAGAVADVTLATIRPRQETP